MFLLTWPYIEHHNLRVRFIALAQAHYPGILQRAKAAFNFLRKLGMYSVLLYTQLMYTGCGLQATRTALILMERMIQFSVRNSILRILIMFIIYGAVDDQKIVHFPKLNKYGI